MYLLVISWKKVVEDVMCVLVFDRVYLDVYVFWVMVNIDLDKFDEV